MCDHCNAVFQAQISAGTFVPPPAKDWLVSRLTDRGPSARTRYHVEGENLNCLPDCPERRFSWDVPDLCDRYDLSRLPSPAMKGIAARDAYPACPDYETRMRRTYVEGDVVAVGPAYRTTDSYDCDGIEGVYTIVNVELPLEGSRRCAEYKIVRGIVTGPIQPESADFDVVGGARFIPLPLDVQNVIARQRITYAERVWLESATEGDSRAALAALDLAVARHRNLQYRRDL